MMRTRNRLLALMVFVSAACVSASADIPRPKGNDGGPRPQPALSAEARMMIEPFGSGTEARLVIPRSVLRELGVETNGGAPAPAAGLFGAGPGGAQTVVAGLFLSLGVMLGGVWLVRSRRAVAGRPRAALGALALLVLGAGGGVAYANIAPPRVAQPLNWNILVSEAKRSGAAGPVRIEVVEEGGQIMLLLPKSK